MKSVILVLLCAFALAAAGFAERRAPDVQQPATAPAQFPRFTTLDVFVDAGADKLAAYQVEITATTGRFMLVGIAGGEHPAFALPPYYDPAARAAGERVILAAFNVGSDLPTGKTRVAQLQLEEDGPALPTFAVRLVTAADSEGHSISASVQLGEGAHP